LALLDIPKCTFKAFDRASIEYLTGRTIEEIKSENEPADDATLESLGFPIYRS